VTCVNNILLARPSLQNKDNKGNKTQKQNRLYFVFPCFLIAVFFFLLLEQQQKTSLPSSTPR